MGLREGSANTGRFPGSKDSEFTDRCRDFFIRQLQAQRPCLVLALGGYVPPFLAPLSPELSDWAKWRSFPWLDKKHRAIVPAASFPQANHTCALVALTHPSFRPSNVWRRRYGRLWGHAAEVAMVRQALVECPELRTGATA